jgi:hypothetical protein
MPLAPVPPVSGVSRPAMAAAQQLLWMAAMAELPSPQALLGGAEMDKLIATGLPQARAQEPRRWSGDGWLMWRRGGDGAPPSGFAPPSYGASQGGVVLRYRLAPSSPFKPTLYLRGTGAMDGSGETDSAFGFSVRPIPRLPLIAAVEARATRYASGITRVRPAAMVVTELVPQPLPFAMRAEIYGSAGYVGGPGATAFVDGQMRVDHHIAMVGPSELRAGAGAWGGAQVGASRLDIGPTATLGVFGGHMGARLGVDWRFRVVGNAAPTSGPALTLSAGF